MSMNGLTVSKLTSLFFHFVDVLKHVAMRLFDEKGMLIPSTVALTSNHFKYAGELITLSVVQGGPCADFFSEHLYDLLSKSIKDLNLTIDMIEDKEMKSVADKVSCWSEVVIFHVMKIYLKLIICICMHKNATLNF